MHSLVESQSDRHRCNAVLERGVKRKHAKVEQRSRPSGFSAECTGISWTLDLGAQVFLQAPSSFIRSALKGYEKS